MRGYLRKEGGSHEQGGNLRMRRPTLSRIIKMLNKEMRVKKCYLLLLGWILLLVVIFLYFSGSKTELQPLSIENRQIFQAAFYSRYNASGSQVQVATLTSGLSYSQDSTEGQPNLLSRNEHDRLISLSQNADITARGEWQEEQVKTFCKKHQLSTAYVLPDTKDAETHLYRHLIFDDQRHFVFCFLPKVGCSNMRRLMLVMQGLLPAETAKNKSISQDEFINPQILKISFLNENLTNAERMERLQTYYKFVMIRNPLERLVSAYRNKIEPFFAINRSMTDGIVNGIKYKEGEVFFENHKHFILSRYRPLDLLQWQDTRDDMRLQVSFSDYVQWILDTKVTSLNEHFALQLTNSQPCMVKYHFYANFKNYSRDVRLLIKRLNTREDYFTDHDSHTATNRTRLLLGHYYSQLSQELKHRLFEWMFVELDFYYHLYPEDQWSHTDVLGIAEPIYASL